MIGKSILIVLIGIAVFFLGGPLTTMYRISSPFKTTVLSTHMSDGSCFKIEGVQGCEDAVVDHESNIAITACSRNYRERNLIFSLVRWFANPFKQIENDIFYLIELETKKLTQLEVTKLPAPYILNIHGLSSFKEGNDSYILAINHHQFEKHSIELFKLNELTKTLDYVKGFTSDKLTHPNDLVVLSKDSFIVLNDRTRSKNTFITILEELGIKKSGSIILRTKGNEYFDLDEAANLYLPSGIEIDLHNRKLYVSNSMKGKISVYDIDHEEDGPTQIKMSYEIELDFIPDNINIDTITGNLYVSGFLDYSILFEWLFYAKNKVTKTKIPTKVVRISNETSTRQFYGYKYRTENIIVDDGTMVSGVSSAVPFKNATNLLLLSYMGEGIFMCKAVQ